MQVVHVVILAERGCRLRMIAGTREARVIRPNLRALPKFPQSPKVVETGVISDLTGGREIRV